MHADSLVAFSMNGEKLPTNHGFPLRAVIPGWYGMDSVKWLRSVEVRHEDEASVSLRAPYVRVTRSFLTGDRPSGPVGAMNVKSDIFAPGGRSHFDAPAFYHSRSRMGRRESHSRGGGEHRWGQNVVKSPGE